jgi:hypothetical protein
MATIVTRVFGLGLLAGALAACSCSRIPREGQLLRSAAEDGQYTASVVSYDAKNRQATLELRRPNAPGDSSAPVYRWYQYDGNAWQPMPMTAVMAPVPTNRPAVAPALPPKR